MILASLNEHGLHSYSPEGTLSNKEELIWFFSLCMTFHFSKIPKHLINGRMVSPVWSTKCNKSDIL